MPVHPQGAVLLYAGASARAVFFYAHDGKARMGMKARSGRRWLGLAAIATVWLALALSPSGAAAVVPDAGCPGPDDVAPPLTRTGDQREAQTFAAGHTGALTRASIEITNPALLPLEQGPGDYLVQILATDSNAVPASNVLASATVPNGSVPVGPTTLDVSFAQPPIVVAGGRYAILVSRPGLFTSFSPHARRGDPCPGSAFWSSGANAAWASEAGGTDLVFQTFVQPVNDFDIVGQKGRLFVRVPGPGIVVLDDARLAHTATASAARKKKPKRLVKPASATASAAGEVALDLRLTKRAIRKVLLKGKLNVPVAVTYTPTGGDPNTQRFKIRVRR